MLTNIKGIWLELSSQIAASNTIYVKEKTFFIFAIIVSLILFLLVFFTAAFLMDHSNKIKELEKQYKSQINSPKNANTLDDVMNELDEIKETIKASSQK
ncbi:MAG: hypothetical protein K2I42_00775 [Anaeroplasmataceae bacterium]|nr:hypothetical protein [Anaeroplasmataceae bacterium]